MEIGGSVFLLIALEPKTAARAGITMHITLSAGLFICPELYSVSVVLSAVPHVTVL